MGTNCLLVARGCDLLLIDTGIGDKHDAKFQEIYGMDPRRRGLPEAIRAGGLRARRTSPMCSSPISISTTAAGTPARGGGAARAHLPQGALLAAAGGGRARPRGPTSGTGRATSRENWEPLFEAGVAELFGDEAEPIPGVKAVRAPGHNADMCIVLLDGGGGREGRSSGPTWCPPRRTSPYPWIMGYDLYPLTTLENKKLWLPRAAAGDWLCIFEHDPDVPFGRLVEEKPGRYRAVPAEVP